MIQERDDIVALDSAIIQNPKVWEASGHLAGFTDPLVQCLGRVQEALARGRPARGAAWRRGRGGRDPLPGLRRRALGAAPVQPDVRDLRRARSRRVQQGLPAPRDRPGNLHQLQERPAVLAQEAAVRDRPDRQVVPQRDHPRQLHLPHTRVRADGDGVLRPARRGADWHERWMEERMRWYADLGIRPDQLRLRAHGPDELSHYSSATSDVEYLFPMGWSELEGIANRGDFDLTQHAKLSGEKLEYVDSASGRPLCPPRDRAGRRASTGRCSRSWSTPTTPRRSRVGSGRC